MGGRKTSWESGHPLYGRRNETEGVCELVGGGGGGGRALEQALTHAVRDNRTRYRAVPRIRFVRGIAYIAFPAVTPPAIAVVYRRGGGIIGFAPLSKCESANCTEVQRNSR